VIEVPCSTALSTTNDPPPIVARSRIIDIP
jgi:hypothetical protein